MYKIQMLNLAQLDLLNHTDYIERMTFSESKATKESENILMEISKLSIFPYMYQKFYKNYHAFTVKNKRIVYYIDEQNKVVVIYRILWWFQNYENYL